jgi:hypothetical protein
VKFAPRGEVKNGPQIVSIPLKIDTWVDLLHGVVRVYGHLHLGDGLAAAAVGRQLTGIRKKLVAVGAADPFCPHQKLQVSGVGVGNVVWN